MNLATRLTAKPTSRRQELRAVALERKHDHAVEVDMLKAHGRDVPQDGAIDFPPRRFAPGIECALQDARVIGHHEIRAERQAVGLGGEFLMAPSAGGTRARVPDLSLQLMRAFVVVQIAKFFTSVVGIGVGAQQIMGS